MTETSRSPEVKMPVLKLFQSGCTTGHDSLIQLWFPERYTDEDLQMVSDMWALMMRQLSRAINPLAQARVLAQKGGVN